MSALAYVTNTAGPRTGGGLWVAERHSNELQQAGRARCGYGVREASIWSKLPTLLLVAPPDHCQISAYLRLLVTPQAGLRVILLACRVTPRAAEIAAWTF